MNVGEIHYQGSIHPLSNHWGREEEVIPPPTLLLITL